MGCEVNAYDAIILCLSVYRWNIQLLGCYVNANDAIILCCQCIGGIFS